MAVQSDPHVVDLLRDAARWRLLGRLFECPSEAWRRDVEQLSLETDDAQLREAAEAAVGNASEGEYNSVFGPGGPAAPREASYHDTLELGSLMSALVGAYAAFGYRPSTAEPPDHVAVEAGFVAYLRLKEAYALATGQTEPAALAREAAGRFLADHLAMSAAPLAGTLASSGLPYLEAVSRLLAERVPARPARRTLPVIQDAADEDGGAEFACAE